MPNISGRKNEGEKSTSSGHGALGMGGQPTDNPRDLNAGGGDPDHTGTGGSPVDGAFGGKPNPITSSGSAGNGTVGPGGDQGIETMPGSPDAGKNKDNLCGGL